MSDSNRLTFEEACRELGISEGELEQIVADGSIASVKDGDSIFFKKDVIDNYKSQQGTEPSILLSDEEINLLDDEEIDFGIDLDEPETEDVPAGAEIPLDADLDLGSIEVRSGDTDPEDTVLNLEGVLDDDSEGTTPLPGDDSGLLESGGIGEDTLLDTDILDLGDDDADTFDLDTAEETILEPTEEGTLLRGGGARVMQMKRKKSHAAWTAMLAVAALVLLLPLSVLLSILFSETFSPEVVERNQDAFGWIEKYGGALKENVVIPLATMMQSMFGGGA